MRDEEGGELFSEKADCRTA